jgi:hypothetical protein
VLSGTRPGILQLLVCTTGIRRSFRLIGSFSLCCPHTTLLPHNHTHIHALQDATKTLQAQHSLRCDHVQSGTYDVQVLRLLHHHHHSSPFARNPLKQQHQFLLQCNLRPDSDSVVFSSTSFPDCPRPPSRPRDLPPLPISVAIRRAIYSMSSISRTDSRYPCLAFCDFI